jgi:hypothetical protein
VQSNQGGSLLLALSQEGEEGEGHLEKGESQERQVPLGARIGSAFGAIGHLGSHDLRNRAKGEGLEGERSRLGEEDLKGGRSRWGEGLKEAGSPLGVAAAGRERIRYWV